MAEGVLPEDELPFCVIIFHSIILLQSLSQTSVTVQ